MVGLAPRRVVVTGIGMVTPLGCDKQSLWTALAGGQSGVRHIRSLPAGALPAPFAAEVWDFDGGIEGFGTLTKDRTKAIRKGLKVMCRESQMGVAAAQRALSDASWPDPTPDPDRCGVVFGSDYMLTLPQEFSESIRKCAQPGGRFDYTRWATDGLAQMQPLWLLKYLPNMPASHIAIYNDLRGPNNSITHREAAGNLAIGEAYHTILRGSADAMVAGATGTRVHPMKSVHAAQCEQLAGEGTDPAEASRPFDRDRTGMVLGEGAGAIVLEELGHALARGATIYGEILGAGSSSVIAPQGVARCERALANAMRACLRAAGLSPERVGHIHAHGLSTLRSDIEEAQAISAVFGPHTLRIPVVAAKSYFGNLGAGSGVVELISSLLALSYGHLFPILNFQQADPECPVLAVRDLETAAGDAFLNLSTTPQGQASAVLAGRLSGRTGL